MATSKERATYWLRKFWQPSFHPGQHGGSRNFKFDAVTRNLIRVILWDYLQRWPLGNIPFFVKELKKLKLNVTYHDLRAIFRAWNWSWKMPGVQQLLKYTPSNLEYYFTFAVGIRNLPLLKLKWLDEAHVVPSHLLKGKLWKVI